jgi:hypothetical protein
MIRVARELRTGPARCRYCGERIVWALSDSNRRVAVNAQASLDWDAQVVLWSWVDGKTSLPVEGEPQRVSTALWLAHQFDLSRWPGLRYTLHPARGRCLGTRVTGAPQLTMLTGGRS